jgi:hypothetical protein
MTGPDDLGAVAWSVPGFEGNDRVVLRFEGERFQLLEGKPGQLKPLSPQLTLPMAIARAREICAGRQPDNLGLAVTALAVALVAMAAPYDEDKPRMMAVTGAPANVSF